MDDFQGHGLGIVCLLCNQKCILDTLGMKKLQENQLAKDCMSCHANKVLCVMEISGMDTKLD